MKCSRTVWAPCPLQALVSPPRAYMPPLITPSTRKARRRARHRHLIGVGHLQVHSTVPVHSTVTVHSKPYVSSYTSNNNSVMTSDRHISSPRGIQ